MNRRLPGSPLARAFERAARAMTRRIVRGGGAGERFSDPKGPDASAMVWRFVKARLGAVRQ